MFTWPRSIVELAEHESANLTARHLSGETGFAAVVSRMLRDLAGNAPAIGEQGHDVPDLARRVAGVAVSAAGTAIPRQSPPAGTGLRAQIEVYLRANLADPALCPDAIAAAHFISRHLHRLFADGGRDRGPVAARGASRARPP